MCYVSTFPCNPYRYCTRPNKKTKTCDRILVYTRSPRVYFTFFFWWGTPGKCNYLPPSVHGHTLSRSVTRFRGNYPQPQKVNDIRTRTAGIVHIQLTGHL